MINKKSVKRFVREGELEKIENYDKAIADKTQTWACHHRLELTLDGEFACSKEDLIRMGMYFNRPYFELIFLTIPEHAKLHNKARILSDETKKKIGAANKGRKHSEKSRKKMSEALKGRKHSEEHRKKISEAHKGKYRTNLKSCTDFGKKYFEHYSYSRAENPKQYIRENRWYHTHNNKCRWE